MTKTSRVLAMTTVLLIAARSEARAQSSQAPASLAFVNVSIGAQPSTRSLDKSQTLPVFGETATISSTQPIHNGAFFDINGGYRVWRGLAVAVGFSSFSKDSDAAVVAAIPNPLIFDQPLTVTTTQSGLPHSERAVYVQAVWFIPTIDKVDVAVSIGPSFIHVRQGVVAGSIPAGTQTLSLAVGLEEATAKGVNVGIDGTYLFRKNLGAGLFLRYNGGSVDLPSETGLKVGGFQVGLGARVRF